MLWSLLVLMRPLLALLATIGIKTPSNAADYRDREPSLGKDQK